jgi:hypothetical protein
MKERLGRLEAQFIAYAQMRKMSTLAVEVVARARQVRVTRDELVVDLQDGRMVAVPLAWFPKLLHATDRQRRKWELLGDGEGIRWPDLDEDLSVAGLLRGTPAPPTTFPKGRQRSTHPMQAAGRRRRAKSPRKASARRT